MVFRFVHTADLHLDSPLKSLALVEPALAERVQDATRQAFTRIVDLCLSERVDALLISGDLYDGDQTSMKTARFIAERFQALDEAGVRVFVIRGNHDHLSRITRELSLPENVHVFGARAGVETIERPGRRPIAVHGLSFAEARAPASLLPNYRAPLPDAVNIGLLHTSLGGAAGHDVYAPCAPAELQAHGFDYWALGHIHKRSVIAGRSTIVMPGMPQGRDIGEAGPKSVTLATVADGGGIALEERRTDCVMFQRVEVDVSEAEDARELALQAAEALREAADGPTIARLTLAGATPLAWRIRRDLDLLKEEIALAVDADAIWVEDVEAAVSRPASLGDGAGAVEELARIARETVLPADGFREAAGRTAEEFLRRRLPADLRDLLGVTESETATALERLVLEGIEETLARLMAGNAADEAG